MSDRFAGCNGTANDREISCEAADDINQFAEALDLLAAWSSLSLRQGGKHAAGGSMACDAIWA